MVKVKECCCGCTLRTGTLILVWIALIVECFGILIYLSALTHPGYSYFYESKVEHTLRSLYFLSVSIIGAGVSVLGIYGIQKNLPQYLTSAFYYFCYYAIYWSLVLLVLIIYPTLYYKLSIFGPSYRAMNSKSPEFVLVMVVMYFFFIALMSYFALVVRSFRDTMSKQRYGGGDSYIPADPSAVAYSVA